MACVRDHPGSDGGTPRRLALRVTLLIGVCAGAYHYSLATLLGGVGTPTPVAWLGLAPATSLLVAAVCGPPAPNEPDIHDRYLDYIVGIPLLASALTVVVVLPVVLATFFWFWRLDLLSLPLFAAGAVALCFGSRALWRLRLAIALLALVCPTRYAVVTRGSQALTVLLLAILPSALCTLAALPVLGRRLKAIARWRQAMRGPARIPMRTGRLAVRRAGPALVILVVAGVVAAAANESLRQFALVERPLGQPLVAQASVLGRPVAGWTLRRESAAPSRPPGAAGDVTWERYQYQPDGPAAVPVTLDLFTAASAGALDHLGVESTHPAHAYRTVEAGQVDLGGGVVGHSIAYRAVAATGAWLAVYWDWPVRTAAGVAYERVVLSVSASTESGLPAPPRSPTPRPDMRSLLVQVLSGGSASAATAPEAGALDFMAGFGRQVVLASARSAE
jgi:hypothetical protein